MSSQTMSYQFGKAPSGEERSVVFFFRPQPEVRLIEMTNPAVVGMATRGYAGKYSEEITPEELESYWKELDLTKLKTPLEMVHATFLIRGVTRSFTHQIVRYRIGTSFVQESLRFSVQNQARILVPSGIEDGEGLDKFLEACSTAMNTYWNLIDKGEKTEDARALLPHAILTNLFAQFSLLTLSNIYRQRTCCQAQEGEWGAVVSAMRREIQGRFPQCAEVLRTPWQESGAFTCGFGASFDRPCIHQAAFDLNFSKYQEARSAATGRK